MKVLTLNVNGLRAAVRKGFYDWVQIQNPDIICIQETKLQADVLEKESQLSLPGYYAAYAHAQKKGYSGVAIFSKEKPVSVSRLLNIDHSDTEGRYIRFDFPNYSIASVYFPSGTSGELRQSVKMSFLSQIESHLHELSQLQKPCVLCGDLNIAHREIDLKNWKANRKNSGFLPEERAWLDNLFDKIGYVDTFRHRHPESAVYTWWSQRGRAYDNDVGWRIDYQILPKQYQASIKEASVSRTPRFSDHAPLTVEYKL